MAARRDVREMIGGDERLRQCSTCREVKDVSKFWKQASRADGIQASCKACMKKTNAAWSKNADPAHLEERNRKRAELVRERRREDNEYTMLVCAKQRAKKKCLPFSITKDDIKTPEFCPVLGIRLERHKGRMRESSPTLDRIIPSKGYIPGNVVVVSMRANRFKSDASVEELRALVRFYEEQLARQGLVEEVSGGQQAGPAQINVSRVQSHQKEEVRQMLKRGGQV